MAIRGHIEGYINSH